MYNLKPLICSVLGHNWHRRALFVGPWECARCGAIEGDELLSAPPMPECKAPRIERSEAVTLTAGDTLIITSDRVLSRDQMESLKGYALKGLPPECKVIVLDAGLKVAAVARAKPVIPQPTSGRERGPIPNIPLPTPSRR